MSRGPVPVVAVNPFDDPRVRGNESDFWLRTRGGHLASFGNLVRLLNPLGSAPPVLENRWRSVRSLAGYYLESFLKVRGYAARAVFQLDEADSWAAGPRPLAVAVSTTFLTEPAHLAAVLARIYRACGEDVPVVVGGPLVWKQWLARSEPHPCDQVQAGANLFLPGTEAVLRRPIYVASEFGEHTLLRILAALEAGSPDLAALPNLVLPTSDGGWRATGAEPEPVDIDRDYPRWDLVEDPPRSMVPMRTSVGCPYKCEFCDFVAVHPRVRLRSIPSILEELALVARLGVRSVNFVDDNALSSAGRAAALARGIAEAGLGIQWGGYMRVDRVSPENAGLLARSGLSFAWCGIESGDRAMLERMNKRCDLEAARQGIDLLTGFGATVVALFVLGFPGESAGSVDTTAAFLNALNRSSRGQVEYAIFPFVLTPEAPIDRPDQRARYGLEGMHGEWRHATMTSAEARTVFAPRLFRQVEVGYTYYGANDSPLWSVERRKRAVAARKAMTLAFLDAEPDDVVQERFEALHGLLHFGQKRTPRWETCLAPREQQPTASSPSPDEPGPALAASAP